MRDRADWQATRKVRWNLGHEHFIGPKQNNGRGKSVGGREEWKREGREGERKKRSLQKRLDRSRSGLRTVDAMGTTVMVHTD